MMGTDNIEISKDGMKVPEKLLLLKKKKWISFQNLITFICGFVICKYFLFLFFQLNFFLCNLKSFCIVVAADKWPRRLFLIPARFFKSGSNFLL